MRCAACNAMLSAKEELWNPLTKQLETLCTKCKKPTTDDPFINFLREITSEGPQDEDFTFKYVFRNRKKS